MAWSTPRTWTSGEVVSAANLNTYVSDNLTMLSSPPFCDVYSTAPGNTSGTAGTATAVPFDSEIADSTGSMHSVSVNTSRITVPIDGLYHVEAGAAIATQTTATYFRGYIALNVAVPPGTYAFSAVPATATTNTYVSATQSRYIRASANQYFEFYVVCGLTNVALQSGPGLRPYMQVRWMGP